MRTLIIVVTLALNSTGAWGQTSISTSGVIESTSGGFKFPDGTVQLSAAEDPPPTPEIITLTAGPLNFPINCGVANNTDTAIVVRMNWCFGLKDNSAPIECYDEDTGNAPVDLTIEPGHYEADFQFKQLPEYSLTCELTYTGFPNEMTGVYCGKAVDINGVTICLPLQAR